MVTVNPEFNKNDDEKSSSPLFSKPKPNFYFVLEEFMHD